MESVCGFRPGRGYTRHIRLDSHHCTPGHTPAILRSILSDLLYFPGPTASHMYIPELFCLYLYGEVIWAGFRLEYPFCPCHVVVGQPRYALMVRAQVPHRRIEVVVYASGNCWLGARGRIPRLPGR